MGQAEDNKGQPIAITKMSFDKQYCKWRDIKEENEEINNVNSS